MLDQGSPEWVRARVGNLGASRMPAVMSVQKNGKSAASRIEEMKLIVAERLTGIAREGYVTAAMQWGIDHEAEAAEEYESEVGEILLPARWTMHPTIEYFGATPDRLIGDDGLWEAKCPSTAKYVQWRMDGVVPPEYVPQLLAQLACTRRKYVMFCAYDPRVLYGPRLFIRRFEPTAEDIGRCEEAARKFLSEVDELFTLVTESQ